MNLRENMFSVDDFLMMMISSLFCDTCKRNNPDHNVFPSWGRWQVVDGFEGSGVEENERED